jgi:predicted phage baseplate assembly protein
MKQPCDCCEGGAPATPGAAANRPGLGKLAYRAGTHADFFDTMRAQLSSGAHAELAGLTVREGDDPAIALFDAWATVADVLSFYQERIANEGYLRTATERRSVLELAHLVGYRLRQGVAASVYLAYAVEKDAAPTEVPAGARANSIPAPGEQMQVFETGAALAARYEWNAIRPRMSRPQTGAAFLDSGALYIQGTAPGLASASVVLVDAGAGWLPYRVFEAQADEQAGHTRVALRTFANLAPALEALQADLLMLRDADRFPVVRNAATVKRVLAMFDKVKPLLGDRQAAASHLRQELLPQLRHEFELARSARFTRVAAWLESAITTLASHAPQADAGAHGALRLAPSFSTQIDIELLNTVSASLNIAPTVPPASSRQMARSVERTFDGDADIYPKLLAALLPRVGAQLYTALRARSQPSSEALSVLALRRTAPMFGHNAPLKPVLGPTGIVIDTVEWPLFDSVRSTLALEMDDSGSVSISAGVVRGRERASEVIAFTRDRNFPAEQSALIKLGALATVTIKASYTGDSMNFDSIGADFAPLGRSYVLEPGNLGPRRVIVHGKERELPANARIEIHEANADIVVTARDNDGTRLLVFDETAPGTASAEQSLIVALDAVYDKAVAGGWVVVERAGRPPLVARIEAVRTVSVADYGMAARVTQLVLDRPWIDPGENATLAIVRGATVHLISETLAPANAPVTDDVCGKSIELDGLYEGLESGRWMIIAGERSLDDAPGVRAAELVMLAGVSAQGGDGDAARTTIEFSIGQADRLAYCYKRDTVAIYANVAPATHGETRDEVLGGGDAARPLQRFVLRQPPLTMVSAATPAGVESTLEVRVNQVAWQEADGTVDLAPGQRAFVTQTDDEGRTAVIFGNGVAGARLPTGAENVTARYRNGIGKAGNVGAGQISLLATRPLGVKGVLNPIQASGGADRESRDQARFNAPLATMALDRLVATRDYADFARLFGGIGKAAAARLPYRSHQLLYLTIAGVDDIPIETSSQLFQNLGAALRKYGDPMLPIVIAPYESLALVVGASVRVLPDYSWELVEPAIRASLLDIFGFQRAGLGASVRTSSVIAAIQAVPGVAYVDLDALGTVDTRLHSAGLGRRADGVPDNVVLRGPRIEQGVLRPAQLAYLHSQVPDTLILNEIAL